MGITVVPQPAGVTPLSDFDRQPVSRIFCGDAVSLNMRLRRPDGSPATPDNTRLDFRLINQRFSEESLWTACWQAGIERVADTEDMVEILIPQSVTANLRRGSYQWALAAEDRLGENRQTVAQGSLLVEYAATSPHKDIPYKD